MMITKKRFFLAAVVLFVLSLTPLYNWIMPARHLTLRGSLPPGMPIEAVVAYRTDSFFCRNFSMGTGSFAAEGNTTEITETTADEHGRYELTFPVERASLWCDWRGGGGAHIYVSYLQTGFNGEYVYTSMQNPEVAFLARRKNATVPRAVVECVDSAGAVPGTTEFIFCRNKTLPPPPRWDNYRAEADVPLPDDTTEVTLDIFFEKGPRYTPQEYPRDVSRKGEYFRRYDLWRANATRAGSE